MGNYDRKNICVQIEIKENLTDPRYLEFQKNWDFTEDEYCAFIKQIGYTATTEISERIIRFFVDYKDGVLMPDRYGAYEPLREHFDVNNLKRYISMISFAAGACLFKKLRKFDAEIDNRGYGFIFVDDAVLKPKRVLPEYMGRITFWFAKQRKIDMAFLEQLVRDFCAYLNTDVGYIFDQENMTVIFDPFYPERVGTQIKSWD